MLRLKTGILLITIFSSVSLFAQQKESIKNYIAQYKEIAIEEMKRTGVPAAITLAQGIHESGVGQSKLAMIANKQGAMELIQEVDKLKKASNILDVDKKEKQQ